MLNVALLWSLPARYLIEEDHTAASNLLTQVCSGDGAELLPVTSTVSAAGERTPLLVFLSQDQRIGSMGIPGCELRRLEIPANAQLSYQSATAILWTGVPAGTSRPPEWFVTNSNGETRRIDGASVPDRTFPQILDDGTAAWIEQADTLRVKLSAADGVDAIDVSGVSKGSVGPIRGAGVSGPLYFSVLGTGPTRWLTVDGTGQVVDTIEAPEFLSRFSHELRPVPGGWIAWDTYAEDRRYVIAWSRDGRITKRELPRGLAFTSVAIDARGEYIAVSATSGLSIGNQQDQVWLLRTKDGTELFRRYAPKYSRAGVALPGGRFFVVGEISGGKPSVRVYSLP
jgi:hypothetical protein